MQDENIHILFADGAVTYSDKRKNIWCTINKKGIVRVRKAGEVHDRKTGMQVNSKVDPETNSTITTRKDGVLTIEFENGNKLVKHHDGTEILTKNREDGEAGHYVFTKKEHYAPVKQIYDPVKARARTVIGLGGTDALMGADTLMERTNDGRITEVLLPDGTVTQSYLERQELPGYNSFCTNMVHMVKRTDFGIIKAK
jgi:hypothetical protein